MPFGVRREGGKLLVPSVGQFALLHLCDLLRQIGEFLSVVGEQRIPLLPQLAAALADAVLEIVQHSVGTRNLASSGQP